MVLQIEDCVDCLTILYPEYSYGFELDHSSGHNMEIPDGLSTTSPILSLGAPVYDVVKPDKKTHKLTKLELKKKKV